MALAEVMDHVLAGMTQVGKHSNSYRIPGHNETMRIAGVMRFQKGRDLQIANSYRFMRRNSMNQPALDIYPAFGQRVGRQVYGYPVLLTDRRKPVNMIAMLMGNEDGLDISQRLSDA